MDDIHREMERYLSHFARTGKRPTILFAHHGPRGPVWMPAVDMYETADALVIVLEVAGINPDATTVHADPGRLVIRGSRRLRDEGAEGERRSYHALEIAYGPFERILSLPPGLDTQAAEASYRDGFLRITLPRRQPHQVNVTTEPRGASS